MKLHRLPLFAVAASFALGYANAQTTVVTDPVGFVTTTITNSTNGTSAAFTPYSPVLFQPSAVVGASSGIFSAVTSNTLTVNGANWLTNTGSNLPGALTYVLIKSGAGQGLLLRATGNTTNTVTVDTMGNDLTAIPVAVSNSFQLIQGETLSTMFGTNTNEFGVVGGSPALATSNRTDRIVMTDSAGSVRTYFFNTSNNRWNYIGGGTTDRGTTPITPYSSVFYYRVGTNPISQVSTGTVPVDNIKLLVRPNGTTFLGTVYPVSTLVLSNLGVQNLPGWKSGANQSLANTYDRVQMRSPTGVVTSYYFTGGPTGVWRSIGGGTVNRGNVALSLGGGFSVVRTGSNAPAQILTIPLQYNLN